MYLVFVPLSCMASILFALSFQPVIDTALSGDLPAFVRASLGCILWGVLDALGLAAVNQTKFRILASVKINLKEDLYRSILSFDYQHFCKENEGSYLSMLNNDVGVLAQDYFEVPCGVELCCFFFGSVCTKSDDYCDFDCDRPDFPFDSADFGQGTDQTAGGVFCPQRRVYCKGKGHSGWIFDHQELPPL